MVIGAALPVQDRRGCRVERLTDQAERGQLAPALNLDFRLEEKNLACMAEYYCEHHQGSRREGVRGQGHGGLLTTSARQHSSSGSWPKVVDGVVVSIAVRRSILVDVTSWRVE